MRALLDVVAPIRCVGCTSPCGDELCERCAQFVDVLTPPICERCGAPGIGPTCCRNLEGFRRARSVVAFVEPARALTLALKRRGRRPLAYALGDLLAALADKHDLRADSVTFVPAGRTAGRRGFDHAELIARAAASSLGLPARALLVRTEDGPRQADVAFAERRSNVRNRFAAEAARGRLLVVDDVFTTGATAEACSLALRAAGAETVDVVTWARTLRRRF